MPESTLSADQSTQVPPEATPQADPVAIPEPAATQSLPQESTDEVPPVVANRDQVHAKRLPPLQQELETNAKISQGILEFERFCQGIDEQTQRIRDSQEGERRALESQIRDAEERLRAALQKSEDAEARLAEVEKQEKLFAEQHRIHDAELQRLIEQNRDASNQQLEALNRIMQKISRLS